MIIFPLIVIILLLFLIILITIQLVKHWDEWGFLWLLIDIGLIGVLSITGII